MNIVYKILSNGYIPIIPILIWNALLTSRLPSAFDPKSFNIGVPTVILVGEDLFRAIIFLLPLVFKINISTPAGKAGLIIFLSGTLLYFLSWLLLIFFPGFVLSSSILGFTAPAYTPLIWLIGLALMVDSYYFKFPYSKWHYILPSIIFTFFHIYHTVIVYKRL